MTNSAGFRTLVLMLLGALMALVALVTLVLSEAFR